MFRALLAHPQEALHKRNLVYCVRVIRMSVGCSTVTVQPCHSHSQLTFYARYSKMPFVKCLLRMSKLCSKHVDAFDSQLIE
jgi:hypothetical protein